MSAHERQGMSGRLRLVASDAGHEVLRRDVQNLITQGGRTLVAKFFTGLVQAAPRLHIAVGRGTTPQAPGDTRLELELARAEARVAVAAGAPTATVTAVLPATGGSEVQAIHEAGVVITVGDTEVLYNRVVFPVVHKSPTMELTLSWEVEF